MPDSNDGAEIEEAIGRVRDLLGKAEERMPEEKEARIRHGRPTGGDAEGRPVELTN